MTEEILKKAREWTSSQFDEKTRKEIQGLIERNDEEELTDRFYKDLEFGTGGMRGIMGPGTNRMNIYTVGKATQGLANYLLERYDDARLRGVSIAYDSRHCSDTFAQEAARVLAANGIKVFLFPRLRPTPLLSFTVRHLKNVAGIVITASHNPKEYNGYKVYSSTGAQVTSPEDKTIVEHVYRVDIGKDIKRVDYQQALQKGIIQELGEEIDNLYLDRVHALARRVEKGVRDDLKKGGEVKVVYTPLHGAGITLVPKALKMIEGVTFIAEKEQSIPDGNFPTTPSPNPEEAPALSRAIECAEREGADIVIASDPDCDRMGLAVPDEKRRFYPLTGNQIGCLLAYLIASSYKKSGSMPPNPAIISTIVSTPLTQQIADEFGIGLLNVLTGFKYIGEKMHEFDEKKSYRFIFGFEESYGYLADTFVRDKDGIIGCVLAVLLVKYANSVFGSVTRFLHFLYNKYGMYQEYQRSFVLKGVEGAQKIKELMESFRYNPPSEISGKRIVVIKDYLQQEVKRIEDGRVEKLSELPKSDVLEFLTADNIRISVRPSGTEPKIKFYFSLKSSVSGKSIEQTKKALDARYEKISTELFGTYGLT